MEIDIANIISAAGTLLAAYFAYNQYTKNKLTDLKVEYFKKEEERRSYHRSENGRISERCSEWCCRIHGSTTVRYATI